MSKAVSGPCSAIDVDVHTEPQHSERPHIRCSKGGKKNSAEMETPPVVLMAQSQGFSGLSPVGAHPQHEAKLPHCQGSSEGAEKIPASAVKHETTRTPKL